jgi:hypothetical protein
MLSAWFGELRPGLLAVVLSLLTFDYDFVPPVYSPSVSTRYRAFFSLRRRFFSSATQHSATELLRRARDELDDTIRESQAQPPRLPCRHTANLNDGAKFNMRPCRPWSLSGAADLCQRPASWCCAKSFEPGPPSLV